MICTKPNTRPRMGMGSYHTAIDAVGDPVEISNILDLRLHGSNAMFDG